jgi:cysteinyl-tRNA synthetase
VIDTTLNRIGSKGCKHVAIRITNTLTGQKEPFETLEPGKVKMYVCGPTVYDKAHIGHAMSAMVFDVIRRYLEYRGYKVVHAQNFTDIDDKIINRAAELGIKPEQLAEDLIQEWLAQTAALHIKPATIYPRATQEIDTIIELISKLIKQSHAYHVPEGDVYFRVTSFKGYGKLSHRNLEDMMAGSRVEVDPNKEHPMDFVLWKVAKPGEPAWDSPWGPGRPGWHIECSAMIQRHLGGQIDIHGGGTDLIFPHHENEITQSESVNCGCSLARYWVHNGMVQIRGEKMSKSIGNLVTINELLEMSGGEVFRFMVLGSHYRSPLSFSDESYESASRGLERLIGAVRDLDRREVPTERPEHPLADLLDDVRVRFETAMDDDFNSPVALAALFDLARAINREPEPSPAVRYAQAGLHDLAGVLGLTLRAPDMVAADVAPFVDLLVEVREDLRKAKQFELSDRIRDRLTELGITLEDSAEGTRWRKGI